MLIPNIFFDALAKKHETFFDFGPYQVDLSGNEVPFIPLLYHPVQSKIWWSSGQSGTTFPSINQGKFWAGWINFFNMVHGWAENGRANSSHLQVASLISKHRAFRRGKASWRSFPTDGCTGAGQSPVAASGCWSSRCCMRIRCLEVLEVLEVVKRLVGENGWTWHSGSEIGCIGIDTGMWFLSIPLISLQPWRLPATIVEGLRNFEKLCRWTFNMYMYTWSMLK